MIKLILGTEDIPVTAHALTGDKGIQLLSGCCDNLLMASLTTKSREGMCFCFLHTFVSVSVSFTRVRCLINGELVREWVGVQVIGERGWVST